MKMKNENVITDDVQEEQVQESKEENIKKVKDVIKKSLSTVIKNIIAILLKTWSIMIALNWLDLLKHPLNFLQTLVLVFITSMLFNSDKIK